MGGLGLRLMPHPSKQPRGVRKTCILFSKLICRASSFVASSSLSFSFLMVTVRVTSQLPTRQLLVFCFSPKPKPKNKPAAKTKPVILNPFSELKLDATCVVYLQKPFSYHLCHLRHYRVPEASKLTCSVSKPINQAVHIGFN